MCWRAKRSSLRNSREKSFSGGFRIAGSGDGASDHEVIGASAQCILRSGDARLIATGTSRQSDARRDDQEFWTRREPDAACFLAGRDDAIKAALKCQLRAF